MQDETVRLSRFVLNHRLLAHVGLVPIDGFLLAVQKLADHLAIVPVGRRSFQRMHIGRQNTTQWTILAWLSTPTSTFIP